MARSAIEWTERPGAAYDGAGHGAVGGDFQDARLGQQSAANAARRPRRADEFLRESAGDPVVAGHPPIEHEEIAIHEIPHAQITAEQFGTVLELSKANPRFIVD